MNKQRNNVTRFRLPDGCTELRATPSGFEARFDSRFLPAWWTEAARQLNASLIDCDNQGRLPSYRRHVAMEVPPPGADGEDWQSLRKIFSAQVGLENRLQCKRRY